MTIDASSAKPLAAKPLIFAYCSEELRGKVEAAAKKLPDYDFLRSSGTWAPLETRTPALVIIEYPEDNPFEFTRLSSFLNQRGILYIALCKQAKTGFDALSAGAAKMLIIRDGASGYDDKFFVSSLAALINSLCKNGEKRLLKHTYAEPVGKIIAIGASTGGSDAVIRILKDMPENTPPIVAVMHMPPVFTKMYSEQLNTICKMSVWEAGDKDRLRRGLALIARGDRHLQLNKDESGYFVSVTESPPIGGFRPSVDLFFESVAKHAKAEAVGVILTGMGSDGSKGLLDMRRAGAFTIGQDEASCVVYGMPKAAWDIGAVTVQAPLSEIATRILEKT